MTPHKSAFVQHVLRTLAKLKPEWAAELLEMAQKMSDTRNDPEPYNPIPDYPVTQEEAWRGLMDRKKGWKRMGRKEP